MDILDKIESRECPLCGGDVEPNRPKAMYCLGCGRNSRRIKQKLENNVYRNKKSMGEFEKKPRERTCKNCNKTFLAIVGTYCSSKCRQDHKDSAAERKINEAVCRYCKVNLLSKGIVPTSWNMYCSDECKYNSSIERAHAEGKVRECFNCSKEVIISSKNNGIPFKEKTNGIYACKGECENVLKKIHKAWLEELVDFPCFMCGTTFKMVREKVLNKRDHSIDLSKWVACSSKCHDLYILDVRGVNCQKCGKRFVGVKTSKFCSSKCNEEHQEVKRDKDVEGCKKKTKHRERPEKGTHLCINCRTSQKHCDWFVSSFRLHPKGAQVQFDGKHNKVVSCPIYT